MLNAKAIIHFCAIAGGMTLAVATSAFTIAPQTNSPADTYFFEYQSGTVSNPLNWTYTPDATGCGGEEKSCKIELSSSYVDESTAPVSIDTTVLPLLPTTTSSASLDIPDENSGIYEDVFNQRQ